MSESIALAVSGPVARLRFTRPELGNAVTPDQARELCAALEQLVPDPRVRVLIITGSGSTFNVGASGRPAEGAGGAATRYARQVPVMQRVVELLAAPSLVSIAAVNGGCAGAGLALALACDLRFAADTARFNTAFLSAGLPGELGAIWFATRLIGAGRTRDLFLLPGKVSAAEMLALGLLNRVVPAADLDTTVADAAAELASRGAGVVQRMKANLERALSAGLEDYLAFELEGMAECLAARDAADLEEGRAG